MSLSRETREELLERIGRQRNAIIELQSENQRLARVSELLSAARANIAALERTILEMRSTAASDVRAATVGSSEVRNVVAALKEFRRAVLRNGRIVKVGANRGREITAAIEMADIHAKRALEAIGE